MNANFTPIDTVMIKMTLVNEQDNMCLFLNLV